MIAERQKQKYGWIDHFRQRIADIRDGSAYPQIFYHLAQAHDGLLLEVHGNTPHERLEDFLGGDKELIEAAYSGFRCLLEHGDLPTVSKIVDLELKGKMHFIRTACLIGMDELFLRDPASALALPDDMLSRLLGFRLSYSVGNDPSGLPSWLKFALNYLRKCCWHVPCPCSARKKSMFPGYLSCTITRTLQRWRA